ncbi:MAG: CRTAC1 family protein [Planctomycetes bacterium]|nr:CRTAC1 family protein [Planctomycetota bacterium]
MLSAALIAAVGCGDRSRDTSSDEQVASPAASAYFTDITEQSGLRFSVERAAGGTYFMPDSMAAGCALFDYDNDGDLDVYIVNGFQGADGRIDPVRGANRLYQQQADGRFVDVTDRAGLGDGGYGMGVAVGDLDNDGDLDVFLANYGPDKLYRNNGDGTFDDITVTAGIDNDAWAASAGFFDYDRDGLLDLFVTNYVQFDIQFRGTDEVGRPEYPGPEHFPGTADVLYHNNGDGSFTDVSAAAGIAGAAGAGLGVVFTDLNGDQRPDIYVANDRQANFAWIQTSDGVFEDRALEMGLALNGFGEPEAGMGVAIGDYDGDLDTDLLVTHFVQETHTLYRNLRPAIYEDVTLHSGLGPPSRDRTGFGTAFLDFDHDGDLDLIAVNGRVVRTLPHPQARLDQHWNPYAEPNQVFENRGDGRFVEISDRCGTLGSIAQVGRGLALGDIDRDGDLDLLVTNANGTVELFRNDVPKAGHWLMVRAVVPRLRRDAIGATLTLRAGDRQLYREVKHTYSYLSNSDAAVHFGIGAAAKVDEIRVRWPDGSRESFGPFDVDRYIEIAKGAGRPAS